MSGINTNLNPAQSLTSIGYRGISPFSAGVTPTPPEVRTYATWNPADKGSVTLSGGNLVVSCSALGTWETARSTISKSSGKWYYETTITSSPDGWQMVGASDGSVPVSLNHIGSVAKGVGYFGLDGTRYKDGASSGTLSAFTTGDVIGVAMDLDTYTITYYKNGVSLGALVTGWTGAIFAAQSQIYTQTSTTNFGATAFAYPVPVGYNEGLYDTVDLTAGLVAHYSLATNSLDTSGNGYDGVDTNVTYNGTYATYNGSANTAVATDLYLTQNFSTSFWYSPISTSGVQYLWANSNSGGSEEGMYFNSGTLNSLQRFTSGYSTISTGATGLTNGVWYYATAMITATGLELYINGTLVASNATTGTVQKFSSLGLFIGDNGFGNNSNINVKKFRIYNRVLNAGEIAALYADS